MAGVKPEGGFETPVHDPMVPREDPSGARPSEPAEPPTSLKDQPIPNDQDDFGDDMDVDEDPMEPMTLDQIIYDYHSDIWNEFCSKVGDIDVQSTGTWINMPFGGLDVDIHVAQENFDELTGLSLDHVQTVKGVQTEVKGLEELEVGTCMTEADARRTAKERKVSLLSSRWVRAQKTKDIVRCRLVVRNFASGAESAFRSGIYAPTSSLDSLRAVLAYTVIMNHFLLAADVSVAFMNAPVEDSACDLVLMPPDMTYRGQRIAYWLKKAMNGLRRAPLLWFLQLRIPVAKGTRHGFMFAIRRMASADVLVATW